VIRLDRDIAARKRQTLDTTRLAKILVETDALLAALKQYYLFGRYLPRFPETPYFLFSQCARLLHEFEVVRKGSDMSTEPGDDHFMRFLGDILLCRLDVLRCVGQPVALPADAGLFRNEPAYCRFWFTALKATGRLAGVKVDGLYQILLGCVGAQGVLNDPPDESTRKAVSRLFQTVEARQLLIHSEWILEDISAAIMSWLAKCDAEECIGDILRATACALRQERHYILWSAIPTGPYRVTRGDCWGRPRGLAGYRLRGTPGKLTLAKRDTGGQIACVFEWGKDIDLRQKSWLIDAGKFQSNYEEMLFGTWEYDTGLFAKGEGEVQETRASWRLEPLEANHLGLISRWTSALVDAVARHPLYSPLANAIRGKLREGKERWEPGHIRWTYIKEMDALIGALDSARLGMDSRPEVVMDGERPEEETANVCQPPSKTYYASVRELPDRTASEEGTVRDQEARRLRERQREISTHESEREANPREALDQAAHDGAGSQTDTSESALQTSTLTACISSVDDEAPAAALRKTRPHCLPLTTTREVVVEVQDSVAEKPVQATPFGQPKQAASIEASRATVDPIHTPDQATNVRVTSVEKATVSPAPAHLAGAKQTRPGSTWAMSGTAASQTTATEPKAKATQADATATKPPGKTKARATATPKRARKTSKPTKTVKAQSTRAEATVEEPSGKHKARATATPKRPRRTSKPTKTVKAQPTRAKATVEKPPGKTRATAKPKRPGKTCKRAASKHLLE